jgi:sirohydrochlorin ferrochelatase
VSDLLQAGAHRVVVATYLLAPGFFADRIRTSSLAAGAAAVSPALGASAEVADVLLDRFAETRSRRRTAA